MHKTAYGVYLPKDHDLTNDVSDDIEDIGLLFVGALESSFDIFLDWCINCYEYANDCTVDLDNMKASNEV